MKMSSLHKALSDFEKGFAGLSNKEKDLAKLQDELEVRLKHTLAAQVEDLSKSNTLYTLVDELKDSIRLSMKAWEQSLTDSLPMKQLSETFSDRVILLVFGKVNAGKSSFCNFLADQFEDSQVQRFYIESGKVIDCNRGEKFSEGIIETTARIQGVKLGDNFVLLDSPGLHSVTDENGDLTRVFTDSADAVLWLTPSSSPGQVQELEDLKSELEKKKPLQPVITRSDEFEEDELNGEIVRVLHNKSKDRRKLQEEDVINRVRQLGLTSDVKEPFSISVHAYKNSEQSPEQLNEAGLQGLFEAISSIIYEARDYKVNKAAQQMMNFLDGAVLSSLKKNLSLTEKGGAERSKLHELKTQTEAVVTQIKKKRAVLTEKIIADVLVELPNIIERHSSTKNNKAVTSDISKYTEQKINQVLQQELKPFVDQVQTVQTSISSDEVGEFETLTVEVEKVSGNISKSLSSSAGGAIGGVIGFALGGPVGAAIGGVIGGAGGSALGEYFVETETITEDIGVSTEKIIQKSSRAIKEALPPIIGGVFDDVIKSIQPVSQLITEVEEAIVQFEQSIKELKG